MARNLLPLSDGSILYEFQSWGSLNEKRPLWAQVFEHLAPSS